MKLIKYEAARLALAEASRIDEVKNIRNQAEALEHYARQRKDVEMETWLTEIKLRASRRIGELSTELEKAPGPGRGKRCPTGGTSFKRDALKAAGLSKSEAHRCEQIARVPEEVFERHIAAKNAKGQPVSAKEVIQVAGRKVRRAQKAEEIKARGRPLAEGRRYHIILADPPWRYRNVISESRRIENHYPTMPLEDIKRLPVQNIAAKDAALFLWATCPGLEEAIQVMNAWGFAYRSNAAWVKPSIGPGYWFRVRHEHLLLGVRGEIPAPAPWNRPDSVIEAARGKHSEKPEEAYRIIERAYPEFSRIELFARKPRAGWAAWGNEMKEAV